ncbi:DUF1998 domain-containing protein [Nanoarchaeota archaeon NZ13-N]|nr:MAG: DUF1998 domain-containing protein [Nanoarchaeota archaeon NZ13-N]
MNYIIVEKIIDEIRKEFSDNVIGVEKIPGREPSFEDYNFENREINSFLDRVGINLYKHQKESLEILYSGKNLVLTTPTASGKSLVFRLYILDRFLSNPQKTYLLIYPMRALLYDQYEKFLELLKSFEDFFNRKIDIRIGLLLGDLSYKEKEKLSKEKPHIIFTTVDNLHLFLLKNHEKFHYFFRNLDLIVVDELHSYRGVFGTNSALVFRRLIRLLKFLYRNSSFKILSLSATLSNARAFAEKIFGLEFSSISENYSRTYDRWIVGIDPKTVGPRVILKRLIRVLLENKLKSLVFLESKKGVEKYKMLIEDLDSSNLVFTYKASYLRDIRRDIERKFKNNEYLILLTTSALELGIDIGDINVVANYGIPRDGIFSLIQRFGRCGRISEGINIIMFKRDALDLYYSINFKELVEKIKRNDIEDIPVNLFNEKIKRKHLLYMISEFGRLDISILDDEERKILRSLIEEGRVKIVKDQIFGKEYAVLIGKVIYTGLRNISDKVYYVIDLSSYDAVKNVKKESSAFRIANMLKSRGEIIEEIDESAFYEYLLPGMVYYSLGKSYRSVAVHSAGNINFVIVQREEGNVETEPLYNEDVRILEKYKEKSLGDWKVCYGMIEVNREYLGYIERIKLGSGYNQDIIYYEKPIRRRFTTKSIWIEIPEEYSEIENDYLKIWKNKIIKHLKNKKYNISYEELYNFSTTIIKDYFYEKYRGLSSKKIREIINKFLEDRGIKDKRLSFYLKKLVDYQVAFRSGLHAIEHNIIKISPIVTYIDSRELGGFSYTSHPQTGKPVIFIYEGYENGVGLAETLYDNIENLINRSIESLNSCKCLDGCPRCIYSSKCGNFNEYLDKYSARLIYSKFYMKVKGFK